MIRKMNPRLTRRNGHNGLLFLTAANLLLYTMNSLAADTADLQACTNEPVFDLLKLITIITIVSLVFEYVLGEIVFGRLPRVRTATIAIGKRIVPWMGAIILIMQLVPLLNSCFSLA